MKSTAEEWLEDWVADNIQTPQFAEEKGDMDREAAACLAEAAEEDFASSGIIEAAGGDLEAYLRRQQNAFTKAHIERKTAKD